jgi:hypothetical protein
VCVFEENCPSGKLPYVSESAVFRGSAVKIGGEAGPSWLGQRIGVFIPADARSWISGF